MDHTNELNRVKTFYNYRYNFENIKVVFRHLNYNNIK